MVERAVSHVVICIKLYARCLVIIHGHCVPLHSLGCHALEETCSSCVGKSASLTKARARFWVSAAGLGRAGIPSMAEHLHRQPPVHCSHGQFTCFENVNVNSVLLVAPGWHLSASAPDSMVPRLGRWGLICAPVMMAATLDQGPLWFPPRLLLQRSAHA